MNGVAVHEDNESIDPSEGGDVVARLVPVARPVDLVAMQHIWEEEDRLAAEIGKFWPAGLSVAAVIAEDRE